MYSCPPENERKPIIAASYHRRSPPAERPDSEITYHFATPSLPIIREEFPDTYIVAAPGEKSARDPPSGGKNGRRPTGASLSAVGTARRCLLPLQRLSVTRRGREFVRDRRTTGLLPCPPPCPGRRPSVRPGVAPSRGV